VGSFPVFNIADASISVGVVVLLLGVWFKEQQEKKKAKEQLPVDSEQLSVVSDQSPVDGEQQKVNSEQS
jgi:signal peptidase II